MNSKPNKIYQMEEKSPDEIDDSERIQIEEQSILVFSNCDKKLVKLVLLDTPIKLNLEQTYQCNCPYCGDKSFKKSFTGQVAVNVYDENLLEMLDTDSDVTEIKNKKPSKVTFQVKIGEKNE